MVTEGAEPPRIGWSCQTTTNLALLVSAILKESAPFASRSWPAPTPPPSRATRSRSQARPPTPAQEALALYRQRLPRPGGGAKCPRPVRHRSPRPPPLFGVGHRLDDVRRHSASAGHGGCATG